MMDQITNAEDYSNLLLNCSATNSVIEEQLEVITNKIKLYETKLKNKSLKFGGYEEMNEDQIESIKKELPNDLKRVILFYLFLFFFLKNCEQIVIIFYFFIQEIISSHYHGEFCSNRGNLSIA